MSRKPATETSNAPRRPRERSSMDPARVFASGGSVTLAGNNTRTSSQPIPSLTTARSPSYSRPTVNSLAQHTSGQIPRQPQRGSTTITTGRVANARQQQQQQLGLRAGRSSAPPSSILDHDAAPRHARDPLVLPPVASRYSSNVAQGVRTSLAKTVPPPLARVIKQSTLPRVSEQDIDPIGLQPVFRATTKSPNLPAPHHPGAKQKHGRSQSMASLLHLTAPATSAAHPKGQRSTGRGKEAGVGEESGGRESSHAPRGLARSANHDEAEEKEYVDVDAADEEGHVGLQEDVEAAYSSGAGSLVGRDEAEEYPRNYPGHDRGGHHRAKQNKGEVELEPAEEAETGEEDEAEFREEEAAEHDAEEGASHVHVEREGSIVTLETGEVVYFDPRFPFGVLLAAVVAEDGRLLPPRPPSETLDGKKLSDRLESWRKKWKSQAHNAEKVASSCLCKPCSERTEAEWQSQAPHYVAFYVGCWICQDWTYPNSGKLICLQCKISGVVNCNVEDNLAVEERQKLSTSPASDISVESAWPTPTASAQDDVTVPVRGGPSGSRQTQAEAPPDWALTFVSHFSVVLNVMDDMMTDGRKIGKKEYKLLKSIRTACEALPDHPRRMVEPWFPSMCELIEGYERGQS